MSSLEKVIQDWLYELNIRPSRTYLHEQLLSHPEYPSLLSITDTLTDLGIENSAYMVEKDKLSEIPIPFLAYLSPEGEFVLVKSVDALLKKYPDFYNQWEGVALVVEKPAPLLDTANDSARLKEFKKRKLTSVLTTGFVLFSLLPFLNNFSIAIFLFTLASLAGVGISILIVQQELGYANLITDKLCGGSTKANCDAILNSKASNVFNGLNLADIGIIYFLAQWLLLTIAFFTKSSAPVETILSVISAAAFPFTFFSIYYQWSVKKWCRLCLIIVSILCIQFLFLLPVLLKINRSAVETNHIILTLFVCFLISVAWLAIIKPMLNTLKETREKALSFSRLKKTPDLFMSMLEKQRTVDATPFKNELQLSNPAAPLQLIFASNPYCESCAKAHAVLHNLIEKYNGRMGLAVRFIVAEDSKDDSKTKAVEYLLNQFLLLPGNMPENQKPAFTRQLVNDWFENMDMGKFMKQYPLAKDVHSGSFFQEHADWAAQNNIQFTPAIFINGFQLPGPFSAGDLPDILFGLLKSREEE